MSKRSNSTLQAHTTSPLWSLPTPDLIDALPDIFANGSNWPMLCSARDGFPGVECESNGGTHGIEEHRL